jgi:hypothetical protein
MRCNPSKNILLTFFILGTGFVAEAASDPNLVSILNMEGFDKKIPVGARIEENPFVKPVDEYSISELVLTGVVIGKRKQAALISGVIVTVGDRIGNNTVLSIERKRVVLKNADGIFSLSFRGRAEWEKK